MENIKTWIKFGLKVYVVWLAVNWLVLRFAPGFASSYTASAMKNNGGTSGN